MDGTNTQTDVTLGADNAGTPKESYTPEEVAKLVTDAKTSVLADVGRLRTEAQKALTAATKAEERIKAMEQAREKEEEVQYQDNDPELRRIRAERAKREAETELATERSAKTELEERLRQLDAEKAESTKEQNAREIATRLNVDVKTLTKLAKFTDGTSEAMEDIAKDLPKVSDKPPLISDSGRGSGGGVRIPTNPEQLRSWIAGLSQDEYEKVAPEINKMRREDKIK